MKKFFRLSIILIILTNINSFAQDCFQYFPTKKGLKLEFTNYDKKGKIQSTTIKTVVDKKIIKNKQILYYKIDINPVDADTTITRNYQIVCQNDTVYINLASLINEDQFSKPGMKLEVDAGNIKMPNKPHVGQQLDGGTITMKMINDQTTIMTIKSTISNRKVASIEKLSTPAGTFNAFKITYDIETHMGFITVKSSAAEWYCKKYGLIKSENYNKRGKLQSYSLLTKIY